MSEHKLYPLLFKPIIKKMVWGSELWALSGLNRDTSVIENGFLAGNDINELMEVYLMDLVGMKTFSTSGAEFPLIFKYLTVNEFLSVQVHPDDEQAKSLHNAYGKTEVWYITNAGPDARLFLGFNKDISPEEFLERCENQTLPDVMNCIVPQKGSCYFIPSGLIHACGGGLSITEIQEVSDITYRIYDWGREHDPATAREMHLDLAMDCIDFNQYDPTPVTEGTLASCPYFTVKLVTVEKSLECEGITRDGFVVYAALDDPFSIIFSGVTYRVEPQRCIMIPEAVDEWVIVPGNKATILLEVTI